MYPAKFPKPALEMLTRVQQNSPRVYRVKMI